MDYDVTVIGSGPGGYIAAIRCAQLGMKTAIVEKYKALGGTCLNVGCIPSKALLDSSEHFYNAKTHFKEHGINLTSAKVDFTRMIQRKAGVVQQTSDGVGYLMRKNKIKVYTGMGAFKDKNTIVVTDEQGKKQEFSSKTTIIATGSKPAVPPFAKIDKERVITSTEALELKKVPKHFIVIGGGYIGLELGSVYARLGAKVTVLEYMERIAPLVDITLSKELTKVLKGLNFDFKLSHKVTSVENMGKEVIVKAEDSKGNPVEVKGDICLVSVGRKAYTESLGLENIGIEVNKQGKIEVNEHLQTKVDNIYAIGDVIDKGPMLAHKAEEEGVFVAETLAGQKPHINYLLIPSVIYTWPEAASVGYTEEQLKEEGRAYKSGSFPFKALGRARASMDTDGLVKVLADKETDEVLGVHIIGPRAADMIAEAVIAMEYRASAEDIARISHAHPTFTEALKEAALAATGNRALNM